MPELLGKSQFRKRFEDRAVVVTALPAGRARGWAERVNESVGRGDASLQTRAEYSALFELLVAESGSAAAAASLALTDDHGQPSEAARAIEAYRAASTGKDDFFHQGMHLVNVSGWPPDKLLPEQPVASSGGSRLELWPVAPDDQRHLPPPDAEGVFFTTGSFSLMNSGNRTLRAPKRSWKINFEPGDSAAKRFIGMKRLNLKAMFNDPSQMREALAWRLFAAAGVPASQHSYARLGINGEYRGLFSVIEEVDRRFLGDHFGKNDKGNLYKAYCGDIGCATLEHRVGGDGDDGGGQYRSTDGERGTYRLKTNDDDPASNGFSDLAELVRTINGVGLPGPHPYDTDAFRASVEPVMNVRCFLRWAGVNLLIGSWDNYFATPANYYLYNSGRAGGAKDFVATPYFTFIPWDYDNSFGIDFFGTRWQDTDIVDWASNTRDYSRAVHAPHETSRIPLVQNLLRNQELLRYYLDHLEHLLDTEFHPQAVAALIGSAEGEGLWGRISRSAYLESDTPYGPPFTGRQFSNDEVYRAGFQQNELHHGNQKVEGIVHYVRMRCDSARAQLAVLRGEHPRGSSGATFSGVMETLPARG